MRNPFNFNFEDCTVSMCSTSRDVSMVARAQAQYRYTWMRLDARQVDKLLSRIDLRNMQMHNQEACYELTAITPSHYDHTNTACLISSVDLYAGPTLTTLPHAQRTQQRVISQTQGQY